jgi:hypothetical protein
MTDHLGIITVALLTAVGVGCVIVAILIHRALKQKE